VRDKGRTQGQRDLGPDMHAVAETHHAREGKKGASSHNLINAA
jgi:hypothetical protein